MKIQHPLTPGTRVVFANAEGDVAEGQPAFLTGVIQSVCDTATPWPYDILLDIDCREFGELEPETLGRALVAEGEILEVISGPSLGFRLGALVRRFTGKKLGR